MTDLSWLPAAAVVAAGVSATILTWWLARAIVAVPPEDRRYLDRPPLALRIVWWPLRWTAHYLDPLLTAAYRERVLIRLRLAGLDYAIGPAQFVAARWLCATAAAWAAAELAPRLGQASPAWTFTSWLALT